MALGGAPLGLRVDFTEDDDALLTKYIAKYKPGVGGRQGTVLYRKLAENAEGKWPWSPRHSWQSWRERYKKHTQRFDAAIAKYQRKHGLPTESTKTPKPAPTRSPIAGPSVSRQQPIPPYEEEEEIAHEQPRSLVTSEVRGSAVTSKAVGVRKRPRDSTGATGEVKRIRMEDGSAFRVSGKGKERASVPEGDDEVDVGTSDYGGELFERRSVASDAASEDDGHGMAASPQRFPSRARASPNNKQTKSLESPMPRPVKPDMPVPLQVSQEPTPPRSGASEPPYGGSTPHSSPATPLPPTQRKRYLLANKQLATTMPAVPVTAPDVPSTVKVGNVRRRPLPRKKQLLDEDDVFVDTPMRSQSPSPTLPASQRIREPPRLEEGAFGKAFTNGHGHSRMTEKGGRAEVDVDSEADSNGDQWPPARGTTKKQTVSISPTKRPAETVTMKQKSVQALQNGLVGPLDRSLGFGPLPSKSAPPTRQFFPFIQPPTASDHSEPQLRPKLASRRPVQVNAEASSSKVMLPPAKVKRRDARPSNLAQSDGPTKRKSEVGSERAPAPAAPHPLSKDTFKMPRATSIVSESDPFSQNDHPDRAASDRKTLRKADDQRKRRQTIAAGETHHHFVPHLDLRANSRMNSRDRDGARQSVPNIVDLRALQSKQFSAFGSGPSSRQPSRRSSSASSRAIASYTFFPPPHPAARPHSRMSGPRAGSARLRLSVSDKEYVQAVGLEATVQDMAANYGFDVSVVWGVVEQLRSLGEVPKVLRAMQGGAVKALQTLELPADAVQTDEEGDTADSAQEELRSEAPEAPALQTHTELPVEALTAQATIGSLSPERVAPNGLHYTPIPPNDAENMRPAHYSPTTPTRARQWLRLTREGRYPEAKRREIRRASAHRMSRAEIDDEEGAEEDGDVEEGPEEGGPEPTSLGETVVREATAEERADWHDEQDEEDAFNSEEERVLAAEVDADPDADADAEPDPEQVHHHVQRLEEQEEQEVEGELNHALQDKVEDYDGDHAMLVDEILVAGDSHLPPVDTTTGGWRALSAPIPSSDDGFDSPELEEDELEEGADEPEPRSPLRTPEGGHRRDAAKGRAGAPSRAAPVQDHHEDALSSSSDVEEDDASLIVGSPAEDQSEQHLPAFLQLPDDELDLFLLGADDEMLLQAERALGRWSVKRRIADIYRLVL